MSEDAANVTGRPWHLWVMGIVLVLWNSLGCLDWFMTQTKNEAYLEASKFTPEQIEFLYSYPTWAVLIWTIAVWGAMLGAIFLLLKKGLAVHLSLLSLITYIVAMIRQYGFTDFKELFPELHWDLFSVLIFCVLLVQLLYARAMANRGVLS